MLSVCILLVLHSIIPNCFCTVQFINTLDPNVPASKSRPIFWPKWNTQKSGALLSFFDPDGMEIIADDFREEPMAFLNNVSVQAQGAPSH